jgi:peptidoglycan L-alanyl-D-glutamate endopeptidase CwlK
MGVEQADHDITHLYPPFATKVQATLAQVRLETAGKFANLHGWILFEGLRTQRRQDWLYAQGRTRPGPVVTQRKVSNHSGGLAADCYPVDSAGDPLRNAPDAAWQIYGHCARANGLTWGGNWQGFVDQPHIEPPTALRLLWTIPAGIYVRRFA